MSSAEEAWIPLVDEPIGEIVAQIQAEDPEIAALVGTPRRLLAFRTFAYIRVGVLLGELLVENEMPPDGSATWVESLFADPEHRARVVDEVRAVAEEVARDVEGEAGPDEEARRRFLEFARRELEA
jgi:hypothetical protein